MTSRAPHHHDRPHRRPRTTRTFLFTDIVGSSRLWEESPTTAERVDAHFEALERCVEAAGGAIFAMLGDGVAASFGSVDAAVAAAVDAQRAMRRLGLAVRMGVHLGDVEPVGGDYRGRPVNRAARIMALGHGGQILVSDVAAALVQGSRPDLELRDLGVHHLRGLAEPERLWQVVHPDLADDFPPVRSAGGDAAPHLPPQRSTLVGRDGDLRRVVDVVRRDRIVVLTGVGGVGKTRLAIRAAEELLADFAGVWFVPLDCVSDGGDVVDAIAATVGAGAVADSIDAASVLLGGERTLLVLDNCEHVAAAAAAVIDDLVARCPRLTVLATSRHVLGVDGERTVPVAGLDPTTHGVDLFRQRVETAGGEIGAGGEVEGAVAELCRQLDGIPLAIELAAARAATLGLRAVADGLDDRLGMRPPGHRGRDERHGTLRATVDWSYTLLDPDERRLFLWLSAFPSGFELDAVQHVGADLGLDPATTTQCLASLVQQSMVATVPTEHGLRHRLLETMRAFATERLTASGERVAARAVMAAWVRTITDLPWADPCTARVERHAIRLEREADTWREAVVHAAGAGDGDLAAGLCGPPVAFFLLGRHDLADVVQLLVPVAGDDWRRRRAVLCARIVSASSTTDAATLQRWADEIAGFESIEPTGLGGLMQWFASAWRGDFERSVELCVAASRDPRTAQGARDLFVGIAVLDRFSLTSATTDPDQLIPRAMEVADRSDVALQRVSCVLGVAWALADRDPEQSLRLVRRALDDIPNVPALTRLTLPGSAARLLARLDPGRAARGLLHQLDELPSRRSFVDLIPLFYGATLLARSGHEAIGPVLATVSVSNVAPYLSMLDFVELARRAAAVGSPGALRELEVVVRAALGELATGSVGDHGDDALAS